MTRTRVVLAVAIVAAVSVAALSALQPRVASEADSSPAGTVSTPTRSPTSGAAATLEPPLQPTPLVTPQPTPPQAVDPLTGRLVSPDDAGNPVVAVMIDDLAPARPQSGFNAAGIVWQAPAEGGIPRYMLLFHATVPAAVGPVRSSREYFVEWAAEWRAMYAHAGGSPQALQTLRTTGFGQWVWNADEFRWGSSFWRVAFNTAPHNLFTDGEHLFALARRLGAAAPSAPTWRFAGDAPLQQRPSGGSIQVVYPYESIVYRYDRETNTYARFIDGSKTPQADAADDQAVAPTNVVVLAMAFGPLNDGEASKRRLEAQDVGHGVAWISTNGVTVNGTWRKTSVTAPTLLFGPDGSPAILTAGQTFVQVMSLTDQVTVKPGRFSTPPAVRPPSLLPL
ncbi:MAG TPA: DUF3048 domain-containing protein [Candidatus Binatus sp.]|nr:DUF3048 domain-containing protein [Candidatus Binatus sp.]